MSMKIATPESLDSFGPFDVPDGTFLLRLPEWEDGREAPWDGCEPPCTLPLAPEETPLPVQKANLKPDATYRGIEVEGDEWMRLACDLARKSVERGGGPFAALVLQVDDATGRILRYWTGRNRVTALNDPTAHAEVTAIREACASLGVFDLDNIRRTASRLPQPGEISRCVVYSSAEPCPMCYAAIRWARIGTIRFAATRFDAAAPGVEFSDDPLYREMALAYAERPLEIRQCVIGNSLDAFNLWKRSDKIAY
ncbi:MAG TPA: nucleoside deaminase [Fibrobacteria bacterium]|nr:nucleoside deaminase [Fibrobacteria bacterium]